MKQESKLNMNEDKDHAKHRRRFKRKAPRLSSISDTEQTEIAKNDDNKITEDNVKKRQAAKLGVVTRSKKITGAGCKDEDEVQNVKDTVDSVDNKDEEYNDSIEDNNDNESGSDYEEESEDGDDDNDEEKDDDVEKDEGDGDSDVKKNARVRKSALDGNKSKRRLRSNKIKNKEDMVLVDEDPETVSSKKGSISNNKRKRETSKKTTKKPIQTQQKETMPRKQWLSIYTRMSPRALYDTIQELTKKQKDEVKELRLGHLLKLKSHEIPTKMAHFVVDRFNPDTMEIDLGEVKIKVDDEAITKILGLPNKGIVLENSKSRSCGTLVTEWKERYKCSGKYVSPIEVKKRIYDERRVPDNKFFKLDFIAQMVGIVAYKQKQGNLMVDYMSSIKDDTDLTNINWCEFVLRALKKCKDDWTRDNKNSCFVGPLTLLTMAYVDGTTCDAFPEERTSPAISFWTKENLTIREKFELENGGFGKGKLRDLYVDVNGDGSEEVEVPISDDLTKCLGALDDAFDLMESSRDTIVKVLKTTVSKFPENGTVKLFVERYKSFFNDVEKIEIIETTAEMQSDEAHLDSIAVTANDEKAVVGQSNVRGRRNRKKNIDPYVPTFNLLGPSQSTPESEAEGSDVDGSVKTIAPNVDITANVHKQSEPLDAGVGTSKSKQPVVSYERDVMDINMPLQAHEKTLWLYMMKLDIDKKNFESKKLSGPRKLRKNKKVDDVESVSPSEGDVIDEETTFTKTVFDSKSGVQTKAWLLTSLIPGRHVSDEIVSCWAALLNYEERVATNGAPKRLYLHAKTILQWMVGSSSTIDARYKKFERNLKNVVEGCEDMMDLRSFNTIVVPILERKHYYLVCFDLDVPAVTVIDNMADSLVSLFGGHNFSLMGTPAKVRHIVGCYLQTNLHPNANALCTCVIKIKKLPWATKDNYTDCGVFAMRHMEMYRGNRANFDCGFDKSEAKQQVQINSLRMKIACKLMSSPVNTYSSKIMEEAKEVEEKLKRSDGEGGDGKLLAEIEDSLTTMVRELNDLRNANVTKKTDGKTGSLKGKKVTFAKKVTVG